MYHQRLPKIASKIAPKSDRAARKMLQLAFLALAILIFNSFASAARSAPDRLADLVERMSPAVVNITTMTKVAKSLVPKGVVPEGSPFEDLFRDFNDQNPGRRSPRNTSALGSGFVVSEDGFVVTNNHVIEGADEIMVEFPNGTEHAATVIGVDKNIDIALLKLNVNEPLDFVSFGNSDTARVGDWVMAIGNPLGQGFSVSAGIISARNRELSGSYDDYIQTDAAINRGNSGGPLFNMDGHVIGVNTAILSPNGGSIGIGFSMSANVVSPVVEQLRQFGEVRRGWLGVSIGPVTEEIARTLDLEDSSGAIISEVFDGGPALKAGLETRDIIALFNGETVENAGELVRMVGRAAVGETVKVVVLRNGKRQTIDVVLGQRPVNASQVNSKPVQPEGILGLALTEIDDALREEKSLSQDASGLYVLEVNEASDAFEKDLRPGDIITDAGQTNIATLEDFKVQVEAAKEGGRGSILLLIRRDGAPRFVVLEIE
jgi:serine protease Do